MTRYQRPKGTHDILPEDQPYWDYVRKTARALAERMGFERLDLPSFEFTPVFAKTAAGEGTDLSREMYSFQDKDGHVVVDQIRAVDRDRLIKRLGVLADGTLGEVLSVLQAMFAV